MLIEQCQLSDQNLNYFLHSIQAKNQLKYLGMMDLGITLTGKHILGFLSCKKWKIESLCLNGNNINYEGAKLLADGL